jgi:hypothetical protein
MATISAHSPTGRTNTNTGNLAQREKETAMSKGTLSRRNLLTGAAAGAVVASPVTAQGSATSPKMISLHDRLFSARHELERLQQFSRLARSKRPSVPACIAHPRYPDKPLRSAYEWRADGEIELAEISEIYEAACNAADEASGYDVHSEAVEAAVSLIGDIEKEIVDFEPRTIRDLRLQVELALHQLAEGGWHDHLPIRICKNVLRLIP